MIKVIDNLFQDKDYLDLINNRFIELDYKLQSSRNDCVNDLTLWNFLYSELNPASYEFLLYKIKNLDFLNIESINRIYANGNFATEWAGGRWHTDDGDITALFYPCEWDIKNGGGTSFKDGTTVDYVQNRLLLFDADMEHKADSHSADAIRYTIAIKMNANWVLQ